MHDGAWSVGRFGVLSLLVGTVVALIVFSPPAYADDDLFTPPQPSIVVGGTVHPSTTIVVDPQISTGTTGPIDAGEPIRVDPST